MTFPQMAAQPVAILIPFANNSRKHTDAQIQAIASSIKQFGFLQPVIVDGNGGIVAGHARVSAAKLLGMEMVPTILADHLSPEQIRLFVIADNRLAEMSTWDNEILKLEVADLTGLGMSLDWLDLPSCALPDPILLDDADPDEEVVAAHDAPTCIVEGDLFCIGDHLILCGDSTNPQHVERVLAGAKPLVCVTDPPYGVKYEPGWRKSVNGQGNDTVASDGKVANDDRFDWTDSYSLFTGNVLYVWHADRFCATVLENLKDCDFEVRAQIVWVKDNFAISRGHYHWGHEPCWYSVRKGQRSNWKGDRKQSTAWKVPKIMSNKPGDDEKTGHGTQKPVELFARPYRNHCERGDHVYEPFSGSGTAMVAAHKCGLVCHAIELTPAYVEAALLRMERLTGLVAMHVESGKTLRELRDASAAQEV